MTDEEAERLMRELRECVRAIQRTNDARTARECSRRMVEIKDQLNDAGWRQVWTKVRMSTDA